MNLDSKRFITPNEVNQSLIRSTNTLFILVYVYIFAHFKESTIFVSYTIIAAGYLLFTIPLYFWSLRCISLPEINPERVAFRFIGLTGDIICLSIVMFLADEGGAPLFFMYLWLIVANGIRYGIWYLLISTFISLICFSAVVLTTPAWQSEDLILISIGMFFILLILPVYILKPTSRLPSALKS